MKTTDISNQRSQNLLECKFHSNRRKLYIFNPPYWIKSIILNFEVLTQIYNQTLKIFNKN